MCLRYLGFVFILVLTVCHGKKDSECATRTFGESGCALTADANTNKQLVIKLTESIATGGKELKGLLAQSDVKLKALEKQVKKLDKEVTQQQTLLDKHVGSLQMQEEKLGELMTQQGAMLTERIATLETNAVLLKEAQAKLSQTIKTEDKKLGELREKQAKNLIPIAKMAGELGSASLKDKSSPPGAPGKSGSPPPGASGKTGSPPSGDKSSSKEAATMAKLLEEGQEKLSSRLDQLETKTAGVQQQSIGMEDKLTKQDVKLGVLAADRPLVGSKLVEREEKLSATKEKKAKLLEEVRKQDTILEGVQRKRTAEESDFKKQDAKLEALARADVSATEKLGQQDETIAEVKGILLNAGNKMTRQDIGMETKSPAPC